MPGLISEQNIFMMTEPSGQAQTSADADVDQARDHDHLPDAAKRALAEAEERRRRTAEVQPAREEGGREGPDPVRYGDWENGGIASDF
jgi:hypothetical protein